MDLSIVFPNLNEEMTLGKCITQARLACEKLGVDFEIIVADNGSTDKSIKIAELAGARVVHVVERGYGAAILGGITSSSGKYIIQLDSDNTYRLDELNEILLKLESGADLVIGNRFGSKTFTSDAMPLLHRYLGNPVLSFIGRRLYNSKITDFHCGLRAYKREIFESTGCYLPGMEFASELILKVSLLGYKVDQFSTRLYADERIGRSHLNTFRDGYRHLRFLFLFSRKRLFFNLGLAGTCISWLFMVTLMFHLLHFENISFGPQSYILTTALGVMSLQITLLDLFRSRLVEAYIKPNLGKIRDPFRYEKVASLASVGALIGFLGVFKTIDAWAKSNFGPLNYQSSLRLSVPSILLLVNSLQILSYAILRFINEYSFESIQRRLNYLKHKF